MNEANEGLWFYEKDGEESGPVPEAELLLLLKAGQVFPDTLLWTESMVDWQPALELEPFRSALREGESVWTPAPRPWVRFWARQVDIAIYEAIALGVMMRTGYEVSDKETFISLFIVLWMILLEAALLQTAGTTVGKWLFNISLSKPDGKKLSFDSSLYRTFLLWVRGLGLGIPFINVVAMGIGLRNLTLNQESSWDRDAGTVVRHRKVSAIRWVGAFLILGTFSLSLTVALWPEIEEQMHKQMQEVQKIQSTIGQKS